MTVKQRKFADEYIVTGNATESAIKAGYSKKSARSVGAENLTKPNIKKYIEEQLKKIEQEKIATAEEILIYWTEVMRGQSETEVIVMIGKGEGISEPKKLMKAPSESERLQASRELAKRLIDTQAEESKESKLDKLMEAIEGGFKDG